MSASNKKKNIKTAAPLAAPAATPQNAELLEKIKTLETQLSADRRQRSNSEKENAPLDLPANKVSFRIDYYKNGDPVDLKGVIEHLSSREKKSFAGLGEAAIAVFIRSHLPEIADAFEERQTAVAPVETPAEASLPPSNGSEISNKNLLRRALQSARQDPQAFAFFDHLLQAEQPETDPAPRESRLLRRLKTAGALSPALRETAPAEPEPETPRESRLLRKLRARSTAD
jgi:hypothetical protein